jgi:HK97 family phage major capsid protein
MATSTALVEQREAFAAKQKAIGEVLELAGNDLDFSRKPVLEKLGATDAADATNKWKTWNREAEAMGQDLSRAELKETARAYQEREESRSRPADGVSHSGRDENGERKSWAQQFVESKEFKASRASRQDIPFVLEDIGIKTLFQTSAGFLPESVRSGVLVEKATRPIQVTDLIPSFPISQPSFVYMEETTRTHGALEKAEGAAYAESTFVWTQKTSPVQKITDSIPVTDEQLEDEQQVKSLLEQRLAFGIRQRLDGQILVGTGVAPLLLGLNAVVGIQTMAKGADNNIVAFMKALTLIRYTGRANPSGAVFHPNDWQDVMLTQNAAGDFLFGNPFMGPGPQSLFGIPIAISDAQTENTALVADFANFTRLDDRRGVQVQTGYVASQFTEGKITLRADMRVAITALRPAAICTITGI